MARLKEENTAPVHLVVSIFHHFVRINHYHFLKKFPLFLLSVILPSAVHWYNENGRKKLEKLGDIDWENIECYGKNKGRISMVFCFFGSR